MTGISWVCGPNGVQGFSWNPIRAHDPIQERTGWHCERVSAGCDHCYSERQNRKAGASGGTGLPYTAASRLRVELTLDQRILTAPLRRRKPAGYFISMTDPFGEWVPNGWLDQLFAIMALCSRHRFFLLTKRAERIFDYLDGVQDSDSHRSRSNIVWDTVDALCTKYRLECDYSIPWPLHRVWIGVSVEDQRVADERIPLLLKTPALTRFVSCEPLLGPVDLSKYLSYLDLVIVGGETGPNARPMHPDWTRSLRDQCAAAGVTFHFKQWGEWGELIPGAKSMDGMVRMGAGAAGRLLDGREHLEVPK
jgi:protein gp37